MSTIGAPDELHDELHIEEMLRRIRREYTEMPGLMLTLCQAQRLWNLPHDECERLLDDLVRDGFLAHTEFGMFGRADVDAAAHGREE